MTQRDDRELATDNAVCVFCTLRERETHLLASTTSTVVPSFSAFVPGWLLVVPNVHVHSLAELKGDDALAFDEDVKLTVSALETAYSSVVSFEHGSAGAAHLAGCGIDHAHLHIVATDMHQLHQAVAALDRPSAEIQWTRSSAPWREDSEAPMGEDYLWVCELDGTAWLGRHSSIKSQVFRRVLALHYGVKTWKWRDDLREATYRHTHARLSATLNA